VDAELYGTGIITNIGVIHGKGRKEPWIIAMNAKPHLNTRFSTMAYAGVLRPCPPISRSGVFHHPKSDQKTRPIGASCLGAGYRRVLGGLNRKSPRAHDGTQRGEKRGSERSEGSYARSSKPGSASSEDVSPAMPKSPNSGKSGSVEGW